MSKFLQLIPLVIEIAKIVEAAVPLSGKGAAKLSFIVNAAATIYEAEESLRHSWKDKSLFLTAVTQTTNAVVGLLNAAGVFKKSTPTPAPAL